MNEIAATDERAFGPPPSRSMLRVAQFGAGLLVVAGLLLAVGVVELVPESQWPASGWDWDILGAAGLRWWSGAPVSDVALVMVGVVLSVPLLALFISANQVHRWVLPDRSTLAFALVGVFCVGGLTIPWVFGHAAWTDRRVRLVAVVAALVAMVATGSFGPLRTDIDVWSWWRAAVVGGGAAIAGFATVVAIERLLAVLR